MGNAVTLDKTGKPFLGIDISRGMPSVSKDTKRGYVPEQKFEYALSGMMGFRDTMEDQELVCTSLEVNGLALKGHSIFVVFDGHGGGYAAKFCKANFIETLCKSEDFERYAALQLHGKCSRADANGVNLLKGALTYTFEELDRRLTREQMQQNKNFVDSTLMDSTFKFDNTRPPSMNTSVGERSGTTCVAVVLTPTHFVCANAGDSRAILRRNGQVLPLSFDHKPNNIPEKSRIVNAKGEVTGKRIDGDLAVSRALGDFVHKMNRDLDARLQKVIATPDFTVYPRIYSADEFIVLACDGIWDVATNQQCSDFVQHLLSHGETDLGSICEEALDTCLERNSRDNMTIAVIGLPAMKADRSSRATMMNAVWGQRTVRSARRLAQQSLMLTGMTATSGRPAVR
jgi:serine/threonine protein phosphatase PrpC